MEKEKTKKKPSGIFGWLLVYCIGLVWGFLASLESFLFEPLKSTQPFYALLVLFSLLSIIFLFIKYKWVITFQIILLWAGFIVGLLFVIIMNILLESIGNILLTLISTIIWSLYWYVSVRVHNTYIN
ncbi:MAG: hypothetical protein Q8L27_03465 [archaeon]|nr:hypothetical protein [archaeon]